MTTTVGVALFLLLSFRNNAAFTRWQSGSDKFKNFCHLVGGLVTPRFAAGRRAVDRRDGEGGARQSAG